MTYSRSQAEDIRHEQSRGKAVKEEKMIGTRDDLGTKELQSI